MSVYKLESGLFGIEENCHVSIFIFFICREEKKSTYRLKNEFKQFFLQIKWSKIQLFKKKQGFEVNRKFDLFSDSVGRLLRKQCNKNSDSSWMISYLGHQLFLRTFFVVFSRFL